MQALHATITDPLCVRNTHTHVARTAELCFLQLHDCHAPSWRQDRLGKRWLHCWAVANEGHTRDASPSL
eukprot:2433324-Lingulodinium_polyedra.AAC.1